jgi:Porin PorA
MRRAAGYVLVGLGALLLVVAPLLRWYAAPRLVKAPLDQESITVSRADNATFLDLDPLSVRTGEQLTATRIVVGDVDGAKNADISDTAVWDVFLRVTAAGDELVSATLDRVAFDRNTQEAVNCCGENFDGDQSVRHQGIEYKFPFGAEKQTYNYFDTTLKRATPMEFQGEEEVAGLNVYRYVQRIDPTKVSEVDTPGKLLGRPEPAVPADRIYSNTRTVWVEPVSGVIVKGQEEQRSVLRAQQGTGELVVSEATLVFTDETVDKQANDASEARTRIIWLTSLGPLVGVLVGIVLVVIGVLLLRRPSAPGAGGKHRAEEREPEPVG